jgi:hypothetical protein
MDSSNVTIVSAFLTNVNNNRNPEVYIEYGKNLLNLKIPKIIFIEEIIYNTYLKNEEYNFTKFVFFKKEQMYYYPLLDKIDHTNIETSNTNKDTVEYMMVQCHKTEWVKMAIDMNFFNTNQFIWIDFGIYHIFENNKQLFNVCMSSLKDRNFNKIRIACGCLSSYYLNNKTNVYPRIIWCFLGGIFGGSSNVLLKFASLMKIKCMYLINHYKILPWEVNIWYLIYFDCPDIFDYYIGEHDFSMILKY